MYGGEKTSEEDVPVSDYGNIFEVIVQIGLMVIIGGAFFALCLRKVHSTEERRAASSSFAVMLIIIVLMGVSLLSESFSVSWFWFVIAFVLFPPIVYGIVLKLCKPKKQEVPFVQNEQATQKSEAPAATHVPEAPVTQKPEAPVATQKPEAPATQKPEAPATQKPEVAATQKPEAPATQKSEAPAATHVPEAPATQKPEAPVAHVPEAPVTQKPEVPVALEQTDAVSSNTNTLGTDKAPDQNWQLFPAGFEAFRIVDQDFLVFPHEEPSNDEPLSENLLDSQTEQTTIILPDDEPSIEKVGVISAQDNGSDNQNKSFFSATLDSDSLFSEASAERDALYQENQISQASETVKETTNESFSVDDILQRAKKLDADHPGIAAALYAKAAMDLKDTDQFVKVLFLRMAALVRAEDNSSAYYTALTLLNYRKSFTAAQNVKVNAVLQRGPR